MFQSLLKYNEIIDGCNMVKNHDRHYALCTTTGSDFFKDKYYYIDVTDFENIEPFVDLKNLFNKKYDSFKSFKDQGLGKFNCFGTESSGVNLDFPCYVMVFKQEDQSYSIEDTDEINPKTRQILGYYPQIWLYDHNFEMSYIMQVKKPSSEQFFYNYELLSEQIAGKMNTRSHPMISINYNTFGTYNRTSSLSAIFRSETNPRNFKGLTNGLVKMAINQNKFAEVEYMFSNSLESSQNDNIEYKYDKLCIFYNYEMTFQSPNIDSD
jgi:hypothetical protein